MSSISSESNGCIVSSVGNVSIVSSVSSVNIVIILCSYSGFPKETPE